MVMESIYYSRFVDADNINIVDGGKTMTTKEFFEKVAGDAELAGKLQKVKTPEEFYEAAKEGGLTDSFEAFTAAVKELKDAAEKLGSAEIDSVVGGGDTNTFTTTTVISAPPCGPVQAAAVI